jgi:hypothetical protein
MVWHLIWADIRRHRVVLALWIVLSVGTTALTSLVPHLVVSPGTAATLHMAGALLQMALFLLSVILAPVVLQTHPLTGDTAFWMTRPISPGRLLASKLILLGAAVVVLPAMLLLIALGAADSPRATILFAVTSLVLTQSLWVAVTTTYAALTQTLPRYVVAVGATLATMVASLFVTSLLQIWRIPDAPAADRAWGAASPGRDLAGLALFTVAFVLAILVQAYSRNRRLSISAGIAGIVVALACWTYAPWTFFDPARRPPEWAADEQAARLEAVPADVRAERNVLATGTDSRWRTIRARARLRGMPQAWTAHAQLVTAELTLRDGTAHTSPRLQPAAPPLEADVGNPTHEAIKTALGVEHLARTVPPRGESLPAFLMPERDFRRLAPAAGRYVARVELLPTHYRVESRLPIKPGAAVSHADYSFQILNVRSGDGHIELTAVESDFNTPFSRLMTTPVHRFYLTNPGCQCAIEIGDHLGSDASFSVMGMRMSNAGGHPFLPRQRRLAYPTPHAPVLETFEIDQAWIEGAELVILRSEMHFPFERRLVIDGFPVDLPALATESGDGSTDNPN